MKNKIQSLCQTMTMRYSLFALVTLMTFWSATQVNAQCTISPNSIKGQVFLDANNNGVINSGETGQSGVLVQAYDVNGGLLTSDISAANGSYTLSGIADNQKVRITFQPQNEYQPSFIGSSNGGNVQIVTSPACDINFGVILSGTNCKENSEIMTTCFVQGDVGTNASEPTIVGVPYNFINTNSPRKFAMHGETGSIWGITYKHKTGDIFTSSFVKQYCGLKNGHDAIFRTYFNGSMYVTELFAKLGNLGQNVGSLTVTDINDCSYGEQVGKIGLGGLVISPDERFLYVVNIYDNTIVRLDIQNPTVENTIAYTIPTTGHYAFALKYYQDKIYVGVTKPGDKCQVLCLDPSSGLFTNTNLSIPAGNAWVNNPVVGGQPSHWLTDIDFTDPTDGNTVGNMLISLSDRIGHMFCRANNRLDEQKGDLMIAFYNGVDWTLENRAENGEFFNEDYWITNPTYHPEITIGSIYAMPGTNSVVSTVFDPEVNAYSGGLHRYNTTNGKKLAGIELYTRQTTILFGKATGFGDIIPACGLPQIEIGNLVWFDENNNGLQDANEKGFSGLPLVLMDEACNVIGTTTTSSEGKYLFNDSNVDKGIFANTTYYVGFSGSEITLENNLYNIQGENYKLTFISNSSNIFNSKATNTACENGWILVNTNHTSHNFDIGLSSDNDCKVQISVRIDQDKEYKIDDDLLFNIDVFNNGTSTLSDVTVEAIIPTSYIFDPSQNPNWVLENGKITSTLFGKLYSDRVSQTSILLQFDKTSSNTNYNVEVHITGTHDGSGNEIQDIGSCLVTPSDIFDLDIPKICDLSLEHRTSTADVYRPNNDVVFNTRVCNQGTINSSLYEITNFLNEEFDFDPSLNTDWIISQDLTKLKMRVDEPLLPGACRDHALTLSVKEQVNVSQIVNYAEISWTSCLDPEINSDFDSNPDDTASNDTGGQPNTGNDNRTNDKGLEDEDDHDPAVILLHTVDLALSKTTNDNRVAPGNFVLFNISIINEGDVPVSKVKIVEYLPSQLILVDDGWSLEHNNAVKEISFPGNLQPGESFMTTIRLQVDPALSIPIVIRNIAEIAFIYDQFGNDVSSYDIDSEPSNFLSNGQAIDGAKEDDIDSAVLYFVGAVAFDPCVECRQGTTATNGQFESYIRVESGAGETWFVESSLNLYDLTSALPPANPTPLADGTILTEVVHPVSGMSYYELYFISLDNQNYAIRVRNNFSEIEQIEVNENTCNFELPEIKGEQSVCEASIHNYTNNVTTSDVTWYVDGVEIGNGNSVSIDWSTYASGVKIISIIPDESCIAPAFLNVALGLPNTNSIVCVGDFNVSLGENCEIVITPSMLIADNVLPSDPYIVILMDAKGNLIPENKLTVDHIGTTVMGKLISACGGNSCWSSITVFDKTAPVSVCQNIELPCYRLDQYEGPFETDNCGGHVQNNVVSETITTVTCDENYVKFIDRIYQATDERGNKSALCNMRISVTRPNLDDIVYPINFSMATRNPLSCNTFEADTKGIPLPSVTGVPTLDKVALYPNQFEACNLLVWYEDKDFGYIGCVRKIVRKWYVYEDWCSNSDITTYDQLIEVIDNVLPSIEPLENLYVSTTGSRGCEGRIVLPLAVVDDICGEIFKVSVTYPGGFIDNITVPTPIVLPIGEHVITYTVYDKCLNSKSITFIAEVEDNTPPVAICRGEIVIGLNSQGEAYLPATRVDDGSFDDCHIEKVLTRRMNPLCRPCDVPSIKGFTYLGTYTVGNNEHYYYLSNHELAPKQAHKMAEAVGGYLVSLTSGSENNWLAGAVQAHRPNTSYYIGLKNTKLDGMLTWSSNEPYSYNNFGVGGFNSNIVNIVANSVNTQWTSTNDPSFYVVEITDPCGFSNDVKFCCEDAGVEENMVILRAIDKSGNWNECMMNVEVQDKTKPSITCPDDYRSLDCSEAQIGMDLSRFGEAVAIDACGATITELTPTFDLNACRVGTIIRRFEANDGNNVATCMQRIYVVNNDPFNPDTDIIAPLDFTTYDGCSANDLKPENLPIANGRPIITHPACGMVADTYKDLIIDIVPDACFKILRTWTIIDWCEMERLGNDYVPYEYKQTIKVFNTIAPDFVIPPTPEVTFFTPKGDCEQGIVNISVTAEDDCTPNNKLRYNIKGETNGSPFFNISGFGHIASLNNLLFPVGTHTITWTFEDQCGNLISRRQIVHVRNNDKPTASSIERVVVALVPWDRDGDGIPDIEKGCIIARTLNASSSSLCCEEPLRFSFSSDINDTIRCFDCRNLLIDNEVEFWVHDCNGNTDFTTVIVDVQDNNDSDVCENFCDLNPVVAIITGDINICQNESTVLTASGGNTFLWSTGATTASITVNPNSTQTYSVQVFNEFNCEGYDEVIVTVEPLPTINIAGDDICIGQSTTLTASGGVNYVWNTGATTPSITVSPTIPTTYTVTVTNTLGCSNSASKTVQINTLPIVEITGNRFVCIGQSTTLTATGGISYLWSNGATTSSITVSPTNNTTYSVTVTNSNNCSANNSITVIVNGLTINPSIAGPNEICLGDNALLSAQLSGGTAISYLWSNGATTQNITVSPNATSTFTVTITDTNGCTGVASKNLLVNPLPNAQITGDNICLGQSTTLTASGGVSYLWSNGAVTPSITVSPNTSTNFSVTVTSSNNCTAVASRLLIVFPLPIPAISGDNNICIGESTTLTASGGTSYLWSTGATTNSITVAPTATQTFSVTVTNQNNCTASTNIVVTVSGLTISPSIVGPDAICLGSSAVLSAQLTGGVAASYLWSTGATTQTITVSPTSTSNFTVTITDTNGCNGVVSKTLTVNPLPNVNISGSDVCPGGNTTLTATGGVSYAWSTGQTTPSINVTPASTSTFTVTATDNNGCTASSNFTVNVLPIPAITFTGMNAICLGDVTTITASGGGTYLWSTGDITAAITVQPTTTTTYVVTVTGDNGCTNSASITVTVSSIGITPTITGDNIICVGDSTVLSTSGGGTYLWSTNETTSSITVSPNTNTIYSVTVTSTNGCTGTASISVTVNPLPNASISGTSPICVGDTITLTASGGGTYLWNTGQTTGSIQVSPISTQLYEVMVTDNNGCTASSSFMVVVNNLPIIVFSGDSEICVGESTTITASGGVSYLWSNGETTSSISVSPNITTAFSVTVTNQNGCMNTGVFTVIVNPLPDVNITGTLMICAGDMSVLSASTGASYIWNTGATTQSITVSPDVTTNYSVTVTDNNGCSASSSVTVIVDQGDLICSTQDITVYLNNNGEVNITPMDISTGSTGLCSNITATVSPNAFFCNDISLPVTVTLTVTNNNTNQSLTCTATVTVVDTITPILTCPINLTLSCEDYDPDAPLSTYGVPVTFDNCIAVLSEVNVVDVSLCGEGLITRTFTLTDESNNSSQCVQLISFINFDPFTAADIEWPAPDVTITNCESASPLNTGMTIVNLDNFTCAGIEITFTDNVPTPLCPGVYTRDWRVVETCNQDTFTFAQTINVTGIDAVINGPDSIFLQRDSVTCAASLDAILHTAVGCNLILTNSLTGQNDFDLTGSYTDPVTNVTLTATDPCTNITLTKQVAIVLDLIEYDIKCFKTYPVMTDLLFVEESVYDHVVIYQGCDDPVQIVASYSNTDINDTMRTYVCDDVPGPPLNAIPITIYFWRVGESAPFTTCQSLVGLTDPNNFCNILITGTVETEERQIVKDVEVELIGSNMPMEYTDGSGKYDFGTMDAGGSYTIIPKKDNNYLEGVSTLDLLYIQRHILGIEKLNSPYKIIAADINRDNKVSASDITALRKVILGINDKFVNNTSWRIVEKAHQFVNPSDPFMTHIPEAYHIEQLNSYMKVDWIGVKIGDVNNTYKSDATSNPVTSRTNGVIFELRPDKNSISVPVYSTKDIEISGFQTAVKLAVDGNVKLESGILDISEADYFYDGNVLRIVYTNEKAVSINNDAPLFYIVMKNHNMSSSEDLYTDLSILDSEIYDDELNVSPLGFKMVVKENRGFELLGNNPNPWANETLIYFTTDELSKVQLIIRDTRGRVVYNTQSNFDKGSHYFRVVDTDIQATGVFIYEIISGGKVLTGKMINIR